MGQMREATEGFIRDLSGEHGPALLAWATRRLGDDRAAEELVQDVLVRAWRHQDQFDPSRGSERQWLFGIARNAAVDRRRAEGRRLRLVGARRAEPPVPDDGGIEQVAERSLVAEALAGLPDHHREVVTEAYYGGRSVREIATRLGLPEGTVKSRMFYAMRALRVALEEKGVLS